jgi:hypothetical protein
MKPESLHALLIDRELGELSSEAVELLDLWLAEHPESAAAVPSIRRTLDTATAAVRHFPELARPEAEMVAFPPSRARLIPLAMAASILILLGGTAWLKFGANEKSAPKLAESHPAGAPSPPATTLKHSDPWARYALAPDPRGGLTVVRRDINPQP